MPHAYGVYCLRLTSKTPSDRHYYYFTNEPKQ
jgi:hypothetical protein